MVMVSTVSCLTSGTSSMRPRRVKTSCVTSTGQPFSLSLSLSIAASDSFSIFISFLSLLVLFSFHSFISFHSFFSFLFFFFSFFDYAWIFFVHRPTTWRCQIVDKHLTELSQKHVETRFVKINAEKSPFLTERLSITVLPAILIINKGTVVDKVIGFDELGGEDDFKTNVLALRLKSAIRYDGNSYEDAKTKTFDEDYDIFE